MIKGICQWHRREGSVNFVTPSPPSIPWPTLDVSLRSTYTMWFHEKYIEDLVLPYKEVGGLDGHLLRYHLELND